MLKKETEGKEQQRSKIWSGAQIKKTRRRLKPRREDDEKRWVRRETKADGKTIGRPRNERREEKEQEEAQDHEWRRRGKCLLCLSACVCVCVRRGCSLLTPCVTTGSALGKYKHPRRSEGDGKSRERQRRERWRKRGKPQVCAAADVYLCVSVCASVGVRVSSLCFSVLAAVHLCHTSAMKSNRQKTDSRSDKDISATTTYSTLH